MNVFALSQFWMCFFSYRSVIPNAFKASAVETNAQSGTVCRSVCVIISSSMPCQPASHPIRIWPATMQPNINAFGTKMHAPFLNFANHWPSPAQISHLSPCCILNFCASKSDTSIGLRSWISSTSWLKTDYSHGRVQVLKGRVGLKRYIGPVALTDKTDASVCWKLGD